MKQNKRKVRKLKPREQLILLIPAIAAIAAMVVVLIVTKSGSSYEIKDSGKQFYAGSSAKVEAGQKLLIDTDGVVTFEANDAPTTLPIYLDNSQTMVLTKDMIYYMPRSSSYTRIAALSEVRVQDNGMINVDRKKKNEKPEAGFMYDGKDFYLFLEPVTVYYMGYAVELSALSYAEVLNGGIIMLFDYETKTFTMDTLTGTAKASTKHGDYEISLLGDSMTKIDGTQILLMTKPRDLEPLV